MSLYQYDSEEEAIYGSERGGGHLQVRRRRRPSTGGKEEEAIYTSERRLSTRAEPARTLVFSALTLEKEMFSVEVPEVIISCYSSPS